MDIGFAEAGYDVVWSNDFDPVACETYRQNHPSTLNVCGSIVDAKKELSALAGKIDLVFGGPPCQGFSVAGKMAPTDPRSKLIWEFLDVVRIVKPKGFVCENVKALGVLEKWSSIRTEFIQRAKSLGYSCEFIVLNSANHGCPQNRERVFFIGSRIKKVHSLKDEFRQIETAKISVRKALSALGPAGSKNNRRVCKAKITLAKNPVMRASPYAGMIFNGAGRPINIEGPSPTLPASMGGNKTPIIDEDALYKNKSPWVVNYHQQLIQGKRVSIKSPPAQLRRLTIDEAIVLQTFPKTYNFSGKGSAVYRQIGNAVPPKLAKAVALVARKFI